MELRVCVCVCACVCVCVCVCERERETERERERERERVCVCHSDKMQWQLCCTDTSIYYCLGDAYSPHMTYIHAQREKAGLGRET